MKMIDVSYDLNTVLENASRFVLLTFSNNVLNEQKITKENFENVLIQINTIIQKKVKEEAAKKRKAPTLAMLSNVLKTFNFQPTDIENIYVNSGIDSDTAKKAILASEPKVKKARKDATLPDTEADPKEEMKKIVTDLTKNPYLTPVIQNVIKGFEQEMLKKIDSGMSKEELGRRIRMQIERIKRFSLKETASGGASSAGNVASIANPGGPMMPLIKRMPPGQSFFAPYTVSKPKRSKKKAKKR